ncbi:MAG: hypothetical protein JNK15_12760 [Planctomycetes bacterium]|nr:hypothetical protein [Planctomycetota bacterium]
MLALALVQPSCFTIATWEDRRPRPVAARVDATDLVAHRVPDESGDFCVQLPSAAMAHFAAREPRLDTNAAWLRVAPEAHAATVAVLAGVAGARGFSWFETHTGERYLMHPITLVLDEDSDGSTRWRLRSRLRMSDPGYDSLSRLPGFTKHTLLYTWYEFDVPCTVVSMLERPAELAEPMQTVAVLHLLPTTQHHQTLARILWTPVAIAGDALCAPWELVWWLTP